MLKIYHYRKDYKVKKGLSLLLLVTSVSFASDVTISSTMNLLHKGMEKINNGFVYNSKDMLKEGLSIVENANSIFNTVDVKKFIKSNKVQVAKNINHNMTKRITTLRKLVDEKKYTEATTQYSKVMNECINCHILIRKW